MTHVVHLGDCRDVMATLPDCSVDAIVTDPPYELGFMGKAWDASGIAYDRAVWAQCLRVLKPGGHLIAFGGSRTYHRMAVAIEDAGFEIRDQIQWIYGSGFPKSLDVSKAMDKQAGAVREKRWKAVTPHSTTGALEHRPWIDRAQRDGGIFVDGEEPATDLAKRWHGWGTALKPAHEPAVLARKPLQGTVADNVTAWGTGALNIEGTRVGTESTLRKNSTATGTFVAKHHDGQSNGSSAGRWPSNVILDEEAAEVLDAQSGRSVSNVRPPIPDPDVDQRGTWQMSPRKTASIRGHSDSGGASRFFYVAKASKAEREAGLDGAEMRQAGKFRGNTDYKPRLSGDGKPITEPHRANHHPTVKPLALMRYLIRMVTPPGGVVLDPFTGSGSTGCAAVSEGFDFIGMDITPEYVEIAQKRIAWHAVETVL